MKPRITTKQHKRFFQLHYSLPMRWTKAVKLRGYATGKKVTGISSDNRLLVELFRSPVTSSVNRCKFTVLLDMETMPRDLGVIALFMHHQGLWPDAMQKAQWLVRTIVAMPPDGETTEAGIRIRREVVNADKSKLSLAYIERV